MSLADMLEIGFEIIPAPQEMLPALPTRQTDYALATTEERRVAMERLEFCRRALALKAELRCSLETACQAIETREGARFPSLLCKGKGGRSALTMYNCRHWMKLLGRRRDGSPDWDNSTALIDNYARGEKERQGDPIFWEFFFANYLTQACLSVSESYRRAAAKIRESNPFAVLPAEHQCRYQVERLEASIVVGAREGEEALKNGYLDYIRRDWSEVEPGMMLVVDNRQHDCAVRKWDTEKNCWVAKRPYMCAMIDARSWVVAGWTITTEAPDANIIANTLALAIYNLGMRCPRYYYSDNGADFRKRGFATDVEIDGHKTCILRELGIDDITSLPYNAKAKTVERFFRDVADQFDRAQASYLGNKPGARPDAAAYYWKNPEQLPSEQEFCQQVSDFFLDYYSRPKMGKIHGGRSPIEIWNSRPASAPQWTPERLAFAFLLPLNETRTVHRGPAITIDKVEYYSDDLRPYLDKTVMVKVDRLVPERVFAFEPDGRLICICGTRALIKAVALGDADARQSISESIARSRRQLKDVYAMIDELTGGRHLASPAELLAAPFDAIPIKVGQMSSVKGAAHTFKAYALQAPEDASKDANIDFKEDREEAKMEEFAEAIGEEKEEKSSAESLKAFQAMITAKKRNYEEE